MIKKTPTIRVDTEHLDQVTVLVADGVLDSSTYRNFRDEVIKAALDEPLAVLVDVNALLVPSKSAWSVFTSARWHVSTWPDVPLLLLCDDWARRRAIAGRGVTRYVPVYASREHALGALGDRSVRTRRRARIELPAAKSSVNLARAAISEWLSQWEQPHLIPVAGTVATVLVENVLAHTQSAPIMVVESYEDTVTVALEDCCRQPATRREDPTRGSDMLSGLAIVSALSRAWGSTPTSSGKSVWALVGQENQL
ncbi:sulfate transporter [Mycobacterium sp. 1423905.2]|uniref:sulfate transporter n=1 Tax=Mycobacterium sp. 1423905.2 TaxID=1856859 RepID=UPI000800D2A9|nr:sulfate transporter [Mycobacterium sp. 1423905.2]OBJ54908.1 sulfate transporter [Mycobacterium sp. 1423905.2]